MKTLKPQIPYDTTTHVVLAHITLQFLCYLAGIQRQVGWSHGGELCPFLEFCLSENLHGYGSP